MCACVCLCVCVCERERDRERGRGRERVCERKRLYQPKCVFLCAYTLATLETGILARKAYKERALDIVTHTHTHAHAHTHAHTHTHIHTHTRTHTYHGALKLSNTISGLLVLPHTFTHIATHMHTFCHTHTVSLTLTISPYLYICIHMLIIDYNSPDFGNT